MVSLVKRYSVLPSPSARNLPSVPSLAICSVTGLGAEAAAVGEAVGANVGGTVVGAIVGTAAGAAVGCAGAAGVAHAVTINTTASDIIPSKTRDFIFISSSKRLANLLSACIHIYVGQ